MFKKRKTKEKSPVNMKSIEIIRLNCLIKNAICSAEALKTTMSASDKINLDSFILFPLEEGLTQNMQNQVIDNICCQSEEK